MSNQVPSRRLMLLGGLGILALGPVACTRPGAVTSSGALARILSSRNVRIGFVQLAPWASRTQSGEVEGSYVELARQVFAAVNVTVDFVETTWANFAAGVQGSQFDFSIVPSYPTPQRATAVAFTEAISYLENTALVRSNDTRFRSVADCNRDGVQIVAIEGEQSVEFIRNNLPRATLRTFTHGDFSLLYSEVSNQRADVAFGYVDSVARYVATHSGVRDIAPGRPYSTLPICWATRIEDTDLREFLNASILYFKGNGTVASLEARFAQSAQ